MKSKLLYIFLLVPFAFMATGCHREYPLPEADSPAAIVYGAKCGICHPAPQPQTHTDIGWERVITRMEKNAAAIGMTPLLSEEEKSIIFSYLKKHARKTLY